MTQLKCRVSLRDKVTDIVDDLSLARASLLTRPKDKIEVGLRSIQPIACGGWRSADDIRIVGRRKEYKTHRSSFRKDEVLQKLRRGCRISLLQLLQNHLVIFSLRAPSCRR